MNYCIYIRKRKNKPFCKLIDKEITFDCCKKCDIDNRYQKPKKSGLKQKSRVKSGIKKQTYKHQKVDKNRYSIIVDNLSKCCHPNCECTDINLHEVFYGAYRHTSIKYGLVIPLCPKHHSIGPLAIHNDREFDLKMKFLAQEIFISKYGYDLFMKEFKIDYIEKYKKGS